jgi:hypothetical protein
MTDLPQTLTPELLAFQKAFVDGCLTKVWDVQADDVRLA